MSEYRIRNTVQARRVTEVEYIVLPSGGRYVDCGEWVLTHTYDDVVTTSVLSDGDFNSLYESIPNEPAPRKK